MQWFFGWNWNLCSLFIFYLGHILGRRWVDVRLLVCWTAATVNGIFPKKTNCPDLHSFSSFRRSSKTVLLTCISFCSDERTFDRHNRGSRGSWLYTHDLSSLPCRNRYDDRHQTGKHCVHSRRINMLNGVRILVAKNQDSGTICMKRKCMDYGQYSFGIWWCHSAQTTVTSLNVGPFPCTSLLYFDSAEACAKQTKTFTWDKVFIAI